jgi:Tfp pilus assembly protein PilV
MINGLFKNDTKNSKGISIIESLVCLVIVGIGFIAINQMIAFSISSMDRSMERTKVNFLSESAVEDIMGDPNNASSYNFTEQCNKGS